MPPERGDPARAVSGAVKGASLGFAGSLLYTLGYAIWSVAGRFGKDQGFYAGLTGWELIGDALGGLLLVLSIAAIIAVLPATLLGSVTGAAIALLLQVFRVRRPLSAWLVSTMVTFLVAFAVTWGYWIPRRGAESPPPFDELVTFLFIPALIYLTSGGVLGLWILLAPPHLRRRPDSKMSATGR